MSERRRRRLAAVLGAVALAAGTCALAAPASALAATPVDFATHCIPPAIAGIPPIDGTTNATVTVDNAAVRKALRNPQRQLPPATEGHEVG